MTSDRPYRKALPFPVARDEIVRFAGKQFDPEIVRLFCSLPEERWENIRLDLKFPRLAKPIQAPMAPRLSRPVFREEPRAASN